MKVNMIANAARTERGEVLTIDMLKAELRETKELNATTAKGEAAKELHVKNLEAAIKYKQNREL